MGKPRNLGVGYLEQRGLSLWMQCPFEAPEARAADDANLRIFEFFGEQVADVVRRLGGFGEDSFWHFGGLWVVRSEAGGWWL